MSPLDHLAFMVGSWQIQGHLQGRPITGRATVERSGVGLLYREVIDGYEDLCLYRVDAHGELEVHHFSEDGAFRHAVHVMDDGRGVHWVPNSPLGPVVRALPLPEGFLIEVSHRDSDGPEVSLQFRPA